MKKKKKEKEKEKKVIDKIEGIVLMLVGLWGVNLGYSATTGTRYHYTTNTQSRFMNHTIPHLLCIHIYFNHENSLFMKSYTLLSPKIVHIS